MSMLIDYRERDTTILEILYSRNIPIELVNLPVGDYLWNTNIIERKEIKDFLSSDISGHLQDQMEDIIYNLSEGFPRAMLVLHGSIDDINWQYTAGITMPIFFTKVGEVISNYSNVSFIWLDSEISFANFLSGLYFKSFQEKKEVLSLKKRDKRNDINTLCATRCFDPKIAKKLLKTNTLQEIFNMDTKELIKIDGYGKQRANKFVAMRQK